MARRGNNVLANSLSDVSMLLKEHLHVLMNSINTGTSGIDGVPSGARAQGLALPLPLLMPLARQTPAVRAILMFATMLASGVRVSVLHGRSGGAAFREALREVGVKSTVVGGLSEGAEVVCIQVPRNLKIRRDPCEPETDPALWRHMGIERDMYVACLPADAVLGRDECCEATMLARCRAAARAALDELPPARERGDYWKKTGMRGALGEMAAGTYTERDIHALKDKVFEMARRTLDEYAMGTPQLPAGVAMGAVRTSHRVMAATPAGEWLEGMPRGFYVLGPARSRDDPAQFCMMAAFVPLAAIPRMVDGTRDGTFTLPLAPVVGPLKGDPLLNAEWVGAPADAPRDVWHGRPFAAVGAIDPDTLHYQLLTLRAMAHRTDPDAPDTVVLEDPFDKSLVLGVGAHPLAEGVGSIIQMVLDPCAALFVATSPSGASVCMVPLPRDTDAQLEQARRAEADGRAAIASYRSFAQGALPPEADARWAPALAVMSFLADGVVALAELDVVRYREIEERLPPPAEGPAPRGEDPLAALARAAQLVAHTRGAEGLAALRRAAEDVPPATAALAVQLADMLDAGADTVRRVFVEVELEGAPVPPPDELRAAPVGRGRIDTLVAAVQELEEVWAPLADAEDADDPAVVGLCYSMQMDRLEYYTAFLATDRGRVPLSLLQRALHEPHPERLGCVLELEGAERDLFLHAVRTVETMPVAYLDIVAAFMRRALMPGTVDTGLRVNKRVSLCRAEPALVHDSVKHPPGDTSSSSPLLYHVVHEHPVVTRLMVQRDARLDAGGPCRLVCSPPRHRTELVTCAHGKLVEFRARLFRACTAPLDPRRPDAQLPVALYSPDAHMQLCAAVLGHPRPMEILANVPIPCGVALLGTRLLACTTTGITVATDLAAAPPALDAAPDPFPDTMMVPAHLAAPTDKAVDQTRLLDNVMANITPHCVAVFCQSSSQPEMRFWWAPE